MIFVAVDRFSRLFSIHAQSIPWSLEVHVKEELRVRHRTSVLRASRKPRYESITKIRQQTGTRFKLGPLASNWEDRRVTGVIGVPCDRDDGLIVHAGGVAARGSTGRSFVRITICEAVSRARSRSCSVGSHATKRRRQ